MMSMMFRRKSVLTVGLLTCLLGLSYARDEPKDSPEDLQGQLCFAISTGDIPRAEELLAAGADVNGKDGTGVTPLQRAVHLGQAEMVEFLLDRGADVNGRGLEEYSPLHQAAYSGEKEILSYLLGKGADTGAVDTTGRTPFQMALWVLSDGSTNELAAILRPYERSLDVFALAGLGENKDLERLIAERPTCVHAKHSFLSSTPLFYAVRNKNYGGANLLLESGADVNAKDCDGDTPLRHARNVPMAKLLISGNISPTCNEHVQKK